MLYSLIILYIPEGIFLFILSNHNYYRCGCLVRRYSRPTC